MTESSEYFEIEAFRDILKRKQKVDNIFVYVKWQDFPENSNTWEPLCNLPVKESIEMLIELKKIRTMQSKNKLIDEAIRKLQHMHYERIHNVGIKNDHLQSSPEKSIKLICITSVVKKENIVNKRKNDENLTDLHIKECQVVSNIEHFNTQQNINDNDSKVNIHALMDPPAGTIMPRNIESSQQLIPLNILPKGIELQLTPSFTFIKQDTSLQPNRLLSSNSDTSIKYVDIAMAAGQLRVTKLVIDNQGKVLEVLRPYVTDEVKTTTNSEELLKLLTNKLLSAENTIKEIQMKLKEHNENSRITKNN